MNKTALLDYCRGIVISRIKAAEKAMADAQEAAVSEEKSSAGDKYETGRAMSHLNRDMNARQVKQANDDLEALDRIKATQVYTSVTAGALVKTGKKCYFLATGLGKIAFKDREVIVISPSSPLAAAMLGKRKGEFFSFREEKEEIQNIC
jgi:transcription elongation GreA/GreB family factor